MKLSRCIYGCLPTKNLVYSDKFLVMIVKLVTKRSFCDKKIIVVIKYEILVTTTKVVTKKELSMTSENLSLNLGF